jgi:hypothetical protein
MAIDTVLFGMLVRNALTRKRCAGFRADPQQTRIGLPAFAYFLGFQSRAICCPLASWSGFNLLAM